jgi:Tfp pilus assembly protein PilO
MSVFFQRFWDLIRRYPLVSSCVAVMMLLGAANYYFFDQRALLASQHDDARVYGERMMTVLAGHTRLTAQVGTTQEAVELIERNLIVESDLAENLGYFYKLETASRARIAQISQLNAQTLSGNPFKAVPFSVRVTGSYPQIIGFIRALETGPRLARIREYEFTRSDAKAGTLAMDLTVELLASK